MKPCWRRSVRAEEPHERSEEPWNGRQRYGRAYRNHSIILKTRVYEIRKHQPEGRRHPSTNIEPATKNRALAADVAEIRDELTKTANPATPETMPTQNVNLTPVLDRFVKQVVKRGDFNNASESGFAGSITAALFLKRFVERAKSYVHLDIYGWTPVARPGFPRGGEAQGIRALFALLAERYAE